MHRLGSSEKGWRIIHPSKKGAHIVPVLADFPNFLYEKIYIIENNDNILSLNMYEGCFFMRFENQSD